VRPHTCSRRGASKNAVSVSEVLPFLELALLRQLVLKLRVLGCNAVFKFESTIQMSGSFMIDCRVR